VLRSILVIVASALVLAAPAGADVRLVERLDLERFAGRGAVGLYVPPRDVAGRRELQFELLRRLPSKVTVESVDPLRAPIRIGPPGPPVIWLELPPAGIDEPDQYAAAVVGNRPT
jgi:hypothetical protein